MSAKISTGRRLRACAAAIKTRSLMISMAGGGSDGGGGSGDGTEELASDEDVQTHLALHPGCQERPSETQKNYHLKKKKKEKSESAGTLCSRWLH